MTTKNGHWSWDTCSPGLGIQVSEPLPHIHITLSVGIIIVNGVIGGQETTATEQLELEQTLSGVTGGGQLGQLRSGHVVALHQCHQPQDLTQHLHAGPGQGEQLGTEAEQFVPGADGVRTEPGDGGGGPGKKVVLDERDSGKWRPCIFDVLAAIGQVDEGLADAFRYKSGTCGSGGRGFSK